MSNIWDRFENIATPDEVEAVEVEFTPIEAGDYECVLNELKPAESRQGLPMIKGKFTCVDGGKFIFYNQMLQNLNNPDYTAKNIKSAQWFVGKLLGETIKYNGMSDFAQKISSVPTGGSYIINVSYGEKDLEKKFPRLKVVRKIEDDDELPFEV